jgi:hypothetical protein
MAKIGKRSGTVVAILAIAAGALAINAPIADAAPPADGKTVTCKGGPLVEVKPPVTNDKATEFALTLVAGTAACDDQRGEADRIIGTSYDTQVISGPGTKGTCTDLVIEKPTIKFNWILAGGKPSVASTISVNQIKFSQGSAEIGEATVTGGPLAGASVAVEAELGPTIEAAMADCKTVGVSALAVAATFTFTPGS